MIALLGPTLHHRCLGDLVWWQVWAWVIGYLKCDLYPYPWVPVSITHMGFQNPCHAHVSLWEHIFLYCPNLIIVTGFWTAYVSLNPRVRSLHSPCWFLVVPALLGDNDGSIAIATNPQFHKWSKHIVIRFQWIRQQIQQNIQWLKKLIQCFVLADCLLNNFG
jgi:hypothetical protein